MNSLSMKDALFGVRGDCNPGLLNGFLEHIVCLAEMDQLAVLLPSDYERSFAGPI